MNFGKKPQFAVAALFALISPFAFAAEPAKSPSDLSNFTPRLRLAGRYSLDESTQKTAYETFTQIARFGFNYKYKNVGGVFEIMAGSPESVSGANSNSSTTTTASQTGPQNFVIVRRALMTLDAIKSETMGTFTLAVGRDRVTGSSLGSYIPDAIAMVATNAENAASLANEDGVSVNYSGKFSFGTVGGGVGYYTNAPFTIQSGGANYGWKPFYISSQGLADTAFSITDYTSSSTQSRAVMAWARTSIPMGEGTFDASALYENQPKMPQKNFNPANLSTTNYNVAQDASAFEASVGYSYKKGLLAAGAWYQTMQMGSAHVCTDASCAVAGDINYSAAPNATIEAALDKSYPKQDITTWGASVRGKSQLFGISNLLVDGDGLVYAAGAQFVTGQNFAIGGTNNGLDTGFAAESKKATNIQQYGASAGYAVGPYTLELNYLAENANNSIFSGTNGKVTEKTASIFYLNCVISL